MKINRVSRMVCNESTVSSRTASEPAATERFRVDQFGFYVVAARRCLSPGSLRRSSGQPSLLPSQKMCHLFDIGMLEGYRRQVTAQSLPRRRDNSTAIESMPSLKKPLRGPAVYRYRSPASPTSSCNRASNGVGDLLRQVLKLLKQSRLRPNHRGCRSGSRNKTSSSSGRRRLLGRGCQDRPIHVGHGDLRGGGTGTAAEQINASSEPAVYARTLQPILRLAAHHAAVRPRSPIDGCGRQTEALPVVSQAIEKRVGGGVVRLPFDPQTEASDEKHTKKSSFTSRVAPVQRPCAVDLRPQHAADGSSPYRSTRRSQARRPRGRRRARAAATWRCWP